MVTDRAAAVAGQARRWRAVEFAGLYVGVPLLPAFVLPPDAMYPLLFAMTAIGAGLLGFTRGFSWLELVRGWRAIDWGLVALAAAATALVAALLVWWLVPHQAFLLPRRLTGLWLAILALYPLLSVLPQELIFRPLFFRRYGLLFPRRDAALLTNAALFGFAHLMFWNWPAVLMTFAGGLIFARGYLGPGGFATAVVLHAVCGGIVFTSGLGTFFYHGAVPVG
jgi:uncharacterized protein